MAQKNPKTFCCCLGHKPFKIQMKQKKRLVNIIIFRKIEKLNMGCMIHSIVKNFQKKFLVFLSQKKNTILTTKRCSKKGNKQKPKRVIYLIFYNRIFFCNKNESFRVSQLSK